MRVRWRNAPPTVLSLAVGVPSALTYFEPSRKSAQRGLPPFPGAKVINPVLNPSVTFLMNATISVFFFNKVLLPFWDDAVNYPSDPAAKTALNRLLGLDMRTRARSQRALKGLGKVIALLLPAVCSALPMFFMDIRLSNHPRWLSSLIFADFTILSVNGVRVIAFKYGAPTLRFLTTPLRLCYENKHPEYRARRELLQKLHAIKSAHHNVILTAKRVLLDHMQRRQHDKLHDFYELQAATNRYDADAASQRQLASALHLALCQLVTSDMVAPPSSLQCGSRIGAKLLGATINVFSLPGYYLETVYGIGMVAEWYFGHTMSVPLQFVIGSLLFITPAALYGDTCAESMATCYDAIVQAATGLHKVIRAPNRQERWHHMHNMVRAPLSMLQHPGIVVPVLYTLRILAYWTSGTTLALNYDHLQSTNSTGDGNNIARFFNTPSILACLLFNTVAVAPILYAIHRGLVILNGNHRNRQQLRLIMTVEQMLRDIANIDPQQFLQILHDIATLEPTDRLGAPLYNPVDSEKMRNEILSKMLARTPHEILDQRTDQHIDDNWVSAIQTLAAQAAPIDAEINASRDKTCCSCWPRRRQIDEHASLLRHGTFSLNHNEVELPVSSGSRVAHEPIAAPRMSTEFN